MNQPELNTNTDCHTGETRRFLTLIPGAILLGLVTACAAPVQQTVNPPDSTLDANTTSVVPSGYKTLSDYKNEDLHTVDVTINTHQGRVQFENNAVSDQRAQVLAQATARFGNPTCVSAKTGLVNSRKASTLEDCVFVLPEQKLAYAGAPIDSIRYRFLDDRLLQMKLVFDRKMISSHGAETLHSRLSRDLDLPPPSLNLSSGEANEWRVEQDQITLQQTGSDLTALKISDARLTPLVITMPN